MASIFAGIYALVVLVPSLAVTWRRLHDVGKSGAYYFFMLIPVVGWIIVLIQLCKDSQPGENQYGVSPKYPNKYTISKTSISLKVSTPSRSWAAWRLFR